MAEMKIVNLDKIKPDRKQPRKTFDKETLKGMAQTIKQFGIIEPIHVDSKYVIITGERRFRASKIAKMKKVPVIIHKGVSGIERLEMQLIEDVQTEDIPLKERDKAWKKLYDATEFKTKRDLANKLGVSENSVAHCFDRLEITPELKTVGPSVSSSTITETITLPKPERIKLIEKAEKEDLGGRKIREYVRVMKKASESIKREVLKPKSLITPKVAEEIMEIPDENLQKEAVKEIKQWKVSEDGAKDIIESKKRVAEHGKLTKFPRDEMVDYLKDVKTGFRSFGRMLNIEKAKMLTEDEKQEMIPVIRAFIRDKLEPFRQIIMDEEEGLVTIYNEKWLKK